MNNSDPIEPTRQLLERGAEIAGPAVGGAIGYFFTGPVGAASGAALGTICEHVLKDVATRILSSREAVRVGAVGSIALEEVRTAITQGRSVRSDGFFDASESARSPGAELFEGILLKAKQQYEEKKLLYLGKLYANVALDYTCSPSEANFLLETANSLTYTQFCLLSLF